LLFVYIDASALAKRYAPEPGTLVVNHLFAGVTPARLHVLNVGVAEVVSLLVRKKNGGRITIGAFSQALTDFGTEVVHEASLSKLPVENALVTAALPLIQLHSINATDSIILRSALDLAAQLRAGGDDLVLITADQGLVRAARAEGLLTFNPETQTEAELSALL
jgi:predicted nucleic acid-binding protein